MAGQDVEAGTAKSVGIVSILILICGIADSVCGFIWVGHGVPGGHGLWSGIGVSFSVMLFNAIFSFSTEPSAGKKPNACDGSYSVRNGRNIFFSIPLYCNLRVYLHELVESLKLSHENNFLVHENMHAPSLVTKTAFSSDLKIARNRSDRPRNRT